MVGDEDGEGLGFYITYISIYVCFSFFFFCVGCLWGKGTYVPEVRVLWEHSAAWMAVEVLAAIWLSVLLVLLLLFL